MSHESQVLISLSDPTASDPATCGWKAARLSQLHRAGFPVPEGLVVSVDGCAEWSRFRDRVPSIVRSHFDGMLAVRSSAVAEDLSDASFAGMYRTVLGVNDLVSLETAISEVISQRQHLPGGYAPAAASPMAVLVQPQVAADAAGVAFSADPRTGSGDAVLVHAVRGIGESLVSGTEDPEEWAVAGSPACHHHEGVLDEAEAAAVAALALQAQAHYGEPVDIEWALAGGTLWLLQCRPITALPIRPDLDDLPPDQTWIKDDSHWSEPITPFGASVYFPAMAHGTRQAFAELGVLTDRIDMVSQGGEPYLRSVPVSGIDSIGSPVVAAAVQQRLDAARKTISTKRLSRLPVEWTETLRQEFEDEIDRMLSADLDAISNADLVEHTRQGIELLRKGLLVHFRLAVPYVVSIYELARFCEASMGWETPDTLRLLGGLSTASSAPTLALRELASMAAGRADLLEALAGLVSSDNLADVDADFHAAFLRFERRFGWRTSNYDPGSVALAEQPSLVAQLITDAIGRDDLDESHVQRRNAEAQAHDALADRPADRRRFDELLAFARLCFPQREENISLTDCFPNGILRRALLEYGRRLQRRQRLQRVEDAVYLTCDELSDALMNTNDEDLAAVVARRRAEERWVRANPGPGLIGAAPVNDFDAALLPEECRRINGSMSWVMGQMFSQPQGRSSDVVVPGRPGSPGRARGTVRIIRSQADFPRLRSGDVLVCPTTSPTWSVLFSSAAALVTDSGGALSHAAIIAREHGIPAVLATGVGTVVLRDGETVVVDGNQGIVERIDEVGLS